MTTTVSASQPTVRDESGYSANTSAGRFWSATGTTRVIWQRIYTHGHEAGIATRAASFDRSHPTLRFRANGWTTDLAVCTMASGLTPQGALLPAGRDILPWEDTSAHSGVTPSTQGIATAAGVARSTAPTNSVTPRPAGPRDILTTRHESHTGRRVLAGAALGAIGVIIGIGVAIVILVLAAILIAGAGVGA